MSAQCLVGTTLIQLMLQTVSQVWFQSFEAASAAVFWLKVGALCEKIGPHRCCRPKKSVFPFQTVFSALSVEKSLLCKKKFTVWLLNRKNFLCALL